MMKNAACSKRVQSSLSSQFGATNGLRQGDALACLLFSVVLEKVTKDSGIQTRRLIFYNLVQILAYADDLDLVFRTVVNLKEAFL